MEGFGVKKIIEQLKKEFVTVTEVVHDKDSSTMRQVMSVYEDVEESLCSGLIFFYLFNYLVHGCKNFKKQIEKLGKKYKELKALASRSGSAMKQILKESNENNEKFDSLLDIKVDHYCGFHEKCVKTDTCHIYKKIEEKHMKYFW